MQAGLAASHSLISAATLNRVLRQGGSVVPKKGFDCAVCVWSCPGGAAPGEGNFDGCSYTLRAQRAPLVTHNLKLDEPVRKVRCGARELADSGVGASRGVGVHHALAR